MRLPNVVSPREWQAASDDLLAKEKEATRAHNTLAAERRRMPMVPVDKDYAFDGPDGQASLLDLFDGRRQLIAYRFFFQPGVANWPESGCESCSMYVDNIGHLAHLHARDTSLVLVSPAPQANIEQLKKRMGWTIPWFTTSDDFSEDFGVDEWAGLNVFLRDGDQVFRSYFVNGEEQVALGSIWALLDLTPFGGQETWEDSPEAGRRPRRTVGASTMSTTGHPKPGAQNEPSDPGASGHLR